MATGEAAAHALRLSPRAPLRLLGDERLAGLARRGDQRAFETIFRRYHQELYRFCRAILADPHEAQDALQSTMEAALRALPDEERRIALRPWLYRVAHNESISILRRRPAVVDPALPEPPEPAADSRAEPRERLRQLVADLDSLPDRQRVALVMRELSGLGYPEIAQALAASEAAARQVVYEARLALREVAQGREMECDEVRRALSERDGRILRARRMRAHLRACETCRDFRAGISRRRSDLQALCPPLPVGVASGLFAAVAGEVGKAGIEAAGPTAAGALGAGGGAAGTGLGVATTSIGSSAALKATSIAAAVTIGAGAAGVAGPVHVPLGNPATDRAPAGSTAAPTTPAAAPGAAGHRSAGAPWSRRRRARPGGRPRARCIDRRARPQPFERERREGSRQPGGCSRDARQRSCPRRRQASRRPTAGGGQQRLVERSGGAGTRPIGSGAVLSCAPGTRACRFALPCRRPLRTRHASPASHSNASPAAHSPPHPFALPFSSGAGARGAGIAAAPHGPPPGHGHNS